MSADDHEHRSEGRINFGFVAWTPKQPMPLLAEADLNGLLAWLRESADLREQQAAAEGHPVEVFGETPACLRRMADFLAKKQRAEAEKRAF